MTKKGSEGAVFIFGETSALNALDLGRDSAVAVDASKLNHCIILDCYFAGKYLCLSLQRVGHSIDSVIAFCSAFLDRYPTAVWCLKESGECD